MQFVTALSTLLLASVAIAMPTPAGELQRRSDALAVCTQLRQAQENARAQLSSIASNLGGGQIQVHELFISLNFLLFKINLF
jgi:hypothetical protein